MRELTLDDAFWRDAIAALREPGAEGVAGRLERRWPEYAALVRELVRDAPGESCLVGGRPSTAGKNPRLFLLLTAAALAREGVETLYLDLSEELRWLEMLIGEDLKEGLVDHLHYEVPIDRCLRPTALPRLSVLTGGASFLAGSPLEDAPAFRAALETLRGRFDAVVTAFPHPFDAAESAGVTALCEAWVAIEEGEVEADLRGNERAVVQLSGDPQAAWDLARLSTAFLGPLPALLASGGGSGAGSAASSGAAAGSTTRPRREPRAAEAGPATGAATGDDPLDGWLVERDVRNRRETLGADGDRDRPDAEDDVAPFAAGAAAFGGLGAGRGGADADEGDARDGDRDEGRDDVPGEDAGGDDVFPWDVDDEEPVEDAEEVAFLRAFEGAGPAPRERVSAFGETGGRGAREAEDDDPWDRLGEAPRERERRDVPEPSGGAGGRGGRVALIAAVAIVGLLLVGFFADLFDPLWAGSGGEPDWAIDVDSAAAGGAAEGEGDGTMVALDGSREAPEAVDGDAADEAEIDAPAAIEGDPAPYSLHVGSYQSAESGGRVVRRLEEGGQTAFLAPVDLGERGRWYRVYAGAFADSASAGAALESILGRDLVEEGAVRRTPWSFRLGVHPTREAAEAAVAERAAEGISAYAVGDGPSVVWAGAFRSEDEAATMAAALEAAGVDAPLVERDRPR